MTPGVFAAVLALFLFQGPAADEEGPKDVEGFCLYAGGAAKSEAALLRAPELFGSVGHFSAVGSDLDPGAGIQTTRLLAGLRYDFVHLIRGNLTVTRALAECNRYRALSGLEGALRSGGDMAALPALAARAAVLRNALPKLEGRIAELQREVLEATATVEELHAVRVRVDGLRAMVAETEIRLVRYQDGSGSQNVTLPELLDAYRKADAEVEEAEGDLRLSRAFGVEAKGGYEELLGTSQGVPLFGIVTLSYNLGNLWQGSANEQAREGRKSWRREQVGMPGGPRIEDTVRSLVALRKAERERLEEVRILAEDLSGQLKELEHLETNRIRKYKDFLWIESTRAQAEQAYLEAHLRELDRFLGSASTEL